MLITPTEDKSKPPWLMPSINFSIEDLLLTDSICFAYMAFPIWFLNIKKIMPSAKNRAPIVNLACTGNTINTTENSII